MKKIIHWLDINFEAFFGMVAFFTMLLIILYQIFARALVGHGVSWGEEICKFCYVWVSYLGLSYATRNSIHIEIDAVRRLLPEKVQKILMIFTTLVMLWLFIRFFDGALQNVLRNFEKNSRASSIDISANWMYMAGPIGYGLGAIRCVQNLIWKVTHFSCSMPTFINPYAVLDGGLDNYCYDEALRQEYREQVPEESYAEVATMKEQRKNKEG